MTRLPEDLIARQLIVETRDGIVVIDEGGIIRLANAGLAALSGRSLGSLAGLPLERLLPPDLAQRHQGFIEAYLRDPAHPAVLGQVREMQLRHRSGSLIPIELKALDLGIIGGKRYFGAFVTDIRDRLELQEQNRALVKTLKRQALTDALTGLPNRRAFERQAKRILSAARRNGLSLTVGIADIDRFKAVNDRHGHAAGDAVLRMVAEEGMAALRAGDLFGRIGGEEFGLMLPGADPEHALQVAERLRTHIASGRVVTGGDTPVSVTISIGLAQVEPERSLRETLTRADRALYAAKHTGRDRVVVM